MYDRNSDLLSNASALLIDRIILYRCVNKNEFLFIDHIVLVSNPSSIVILTQWSRNTATRRVRRWIAYCLTPAYNVTFENDFNFRPIRFLLREVYLLMML